MVSSFFSPSPFNPSPTTSSTSPKMSITQTYFLAHKARAKLSSEAARPDHNLRLLVGHANLLDSLMLDLAEAEREQESWFNQSVRNSTPSKSDNRHVQWADDVVDEDWEADSSDSDSDFDDEEEEEDTDIEMVDAAPLPRMVPASPQVHTIELIEEEDEEDYESLVLTRTPSHITSPPELDLDSDSSEDESMPPSPPTASFPVFSSQGGSQKPRETTVTETPLFDSQDEDEDEDQDIAESRHRKSSFYQDGFYLPSRSPARLVSTISVY